VQRSQKRWRGAENDKIASARCVDDIGLAAVCQLDEILRAVVLLVATMLANVPAKCGVVRTRNGRDIGR